MTDGCIQKNLQVKKKFELYGGKLRPNWEFSPKFLYFFSDASLSQICSGDVYWVFQGLIMKAL